MGEYDDWFGMTNQGCEVWEKHCTTFSYDPVDWSEMYTRHLYLKTGRGYVEGVSKEICESAIAETSPGIVIDSTSFKHSSIEGFDAKYYKRIKGGHRIDFCFTVVEEAL
jgi:hypothetical protein